jgi:hypothetical protein
MVVLELQAELTRCNAVFLGILMATPQLEFSLLYVTRSRLTSLKVIVASHLLNQMNPVCTSRLYFFKINFNIILQKTEVF